MTGIDLDISQIGPALIGYRLEVTSEKGYRVGIRLAHYEILTDRDGDLYILYSDPAHVAVRARPGATVHVVATTSSPVPRAAQAAPAAATPAPAAPVAAPGTAAVPPPHPPYGTSVTGRGSAPGTAVAPGSAPAPPPSAAAQSRRRR